MLGAALVFYLIVYFAQEGFALTLDIANWSQFFVNISTPGTRAMIATLLILGAG